MRTAIILSGQMRTFDKCYASQKWQVYRHYVDPEFFVCCEADAQANLTDLLIEDYGRDKVHIRTTTLPKDLPQVPYEKSDGVPYDHEVGHKSILAQHWFLKQAYNFFEEESARVRRDYELIIRMRPDSYYHRFIPIEPAVERFDCYVPWWGKFGGVNDRMAVMGRYAFASYCTVFNRYRSLLEDGCPFHPETMLAAVLDDGDTMVHSTLMTEFSTLRLNGGGRPAEIVSSDLAELLYGRHRDT